MPQVHGVPSRSPAVAGLEKMPGLRLLQTSEVNQMKCNFCGCERYKPKKNVGLVCSKCEKSGMFTSDNELIKKLAEAHDKDWAAQQKGKGK